MSYFVYFLCPVAACLIMACIVGIRAQESSSLTSTERHGLKEAPAVDKKSAMKLNDRGVSEDGMTLKTSTEVVTVAVTVTDDRDRLVSGLSREHFEIYEDKVKQTLEYFSDIDAPASIGILFDVSGSMSGKLDRAREALKAFIETSHAEDDFFLIAFNDRPTVVAEFTDGGTLLNQLAMVNTSGQTALYDASYLGIEKVKQGRRRKRVLLLLSDGQDNRSRFNYRELRNALKESGVQIYCIGITEERSKGERLLDLQGQSILDELASMSGGKAFFPHSSEELEDLTTRIALELRHQYSLGYVPTNNRRDGKWRKIKVRISPPSGLPSFSIRARGGYYFDPPSHPTR
jgi:Ca-activated chloride channel homolog